MELNSGDQGDLGVQEEPGDQVDQGGQEEPGDQGDLGGQVGDKLVLEVVSQVEGGQVAPDKEVEYVNMIALLCLGRLVGRPGG